MRGGHALRSIIFLHKFKVSVSSLDWIFVRLIGKLNENASNKWASVEANHQMYQNAMPRLRGAWLADLGAWPVTQVRVIAKLFSQFVHFFTFIFWTFSISFHTVVVSKTPTNQSQTNLIRKYIILWLNKIDQIHQEIYYSLTY